MKILYISDRDDPRNHDAGSGVDYMTFKSLEHLGFDLKVAGPYRFQPNLFQRGLDRIRRKLLASRPVKYTRAYLKFVAKQVEREIEEYQPDILFTRRGFVMTFCHFDRPLVYLMDTTLKGNQEQWPLFSPLAYRRMLSWERSVIARSAQLLTFSNWSANILKDFYRVPDEKLTVYPIPASIPDHIIPNDVRSNLQDLDPIKILLVGRDYHRKGVDIAIKVVRRLNELGSNAELRIVGLNGEKDENITYMGLYNKTIPEELDAYVDNYRWANFLIHPARFEAAGIVPSEAAAFAVPTITNDAGGLGTTVADEISGIVLPKDSPADEYVDAILDYVNDPDRYVELCQSARARFDSELSWHYSTQKLSEAIGRITFE